MEAPPAHLIIVCCHGIWLGGPANGSSEVEWLIADFQRGETATFVEHAREGVAALAEDRDRAVLVFSGGPTRPETRLSEARSYANVASRNAYWGLMPADTAARRILVEERALDSYHNVLFSLTLFFAHARAWPSRVTVVGHAFKRERLVDLHCLAALRLRRAAVDYVGVDPPAAVVGSKHAAMDGAARAVDEWRADPHGRGDGLRGKRRRRNPWGVWQGVFEQGMDHETRRGSGLVTEGEGEEETLVDEARRPWE